MNLEGIVLTGLQSVPLQLDGSWGDSGTDWRGVATAAVPLVAISFLQSGAECEWCKSERDEPSPEVRLSVFPYDADCVDVQVYFSIGHGARRVRTLLPSPAYRPELPTTQMLQTARIYRLVTIDGDPAVKLFALFLDRGDVESSRNTLWRVRKRLEAGLEQPIRNWLTRGRTGTCVR